MLFKNDENKDIASTLKLQYLIYINTEEYEIALETLIKVQGISHDNVLL